MILLLLMLMVTLIHLMMLVVVVVVVVVVVEVSMMTQSNCLSRCSSLTQVMRDGVVVVLDRVSENQKFGPRCINI